MKYELIIFDLDGTILDTLEDLADSVNHALAKYGYPTRTMEEVRSFVGNGLMMLTRRAIAPETDEIMIQTVLAEQKAYYKEHCSDKTMPYAGIMELLRDLKERFCAFKNSVQLLHGLQHAKPPCPSPSPGACSDSCPLNLKDSRSG